MSVKANEFNVSSTKAWFRGANNAVCIDLK